MKKHVLLLALILVQLAGLTIGALAQENVKERKYPDMTVNISSGGSDYMITFIYTGTNTASCDCIVEDNEEYYLHIYKDSTDVASRFKELSGTGHLPDGTLEQILGPNYSARWGLRYESNCDDCAWPKSDVYWVWSGFKLTEAEIWEPNPATSEEDRIYYESLNRYSELIEVSTEPIKSPKDFYASSEDYFDKIVLNWEKGSDIPDTSGFFLVNMTMTLRILEYTIYRGSTNDPAQSDSITTLPADSRSWSDNTVGNGEEYFYWVTTKTNGWGGHESVRTAENAVLGKTKNFTVTASDGAFNDKVKIEWGNLSEIADEIRIERSVPGDNTSRDQISMSTKFSTSYDDRNAIPGYNYSYYVTPVSSDHTFSSESDMGFRLPNGTISGYVKSVSNKGVADVQVCATPLTTIPAGVNQVPSGGYCATTGSDGYYEIKDIYYYSSCDFSVIPSKSTDIFNPGSATRTLQTSSNSISGLNFTDQSVIDPTFKGDLFVSKGYFPNLIQLKWEISNNAAIIDHFEIYRRKLNETDSMWVENLAASIRKWEDLYAEANELYQYTLIAKGIPGPAKVGITQISGTGFRTPLATITGRVSFSGGNGVKNVMITATTDDQISSQSLNMNSSSYIEIPQNSAVDFSDGFTFQAYLKCSSTADAGIFSKASNFELNYTNQKFIFKVGTQTVELPYVVPTDRFIHVSAVYTGDSAMLIIPDKKKNDQNIMIDTFFMAKAAITNTLTSNSNNLYLGRVGSVYFNGNMDEVRIWKKALGKSQILADYNRYLVGKENGFFVYMKMNEGFGNHVYDISRVNTSYYENHGIFKGGNVTWSTVVPTIEQLGSKGITDTEGNYIISGVPFLTDGSAYKFTPMLAPHQFDPGYRILFLSEDAVVHNNVNFTDISSFFVNGSVVYRNTTKGVKGVEILIDGQPVFGPDAKAEMTDEKGVFEIQVPVGYHFVSLRKAGHSFDNGGRYPYDEANPDSVFRHNFNQNLPIGNPFIDTTLITVVGRVIGGTSSNTIPMGFEQSVNNIGEATITLDHSANDVELKFDNTGDAVGEEKITYQVVSGIDDSGNRTYKTVNHTLNRIAYATSISTSGTSGEFVARLIPEKFSVVSIAVNADDANDVKNFFGNRVIDLSTNPSLKKEYSYDDDGQLLDSMKYHVKLNYVFQTQPEIKVTNTDDDEIFCGEKEIVYTNPVNGEESTIIVSEHFNYPIFEMFKSYSPKISVFESYLNYDKPQEETYQPIKEAEIQIINNLAFTQTNKVIQLTPEMDGIVVDTFRVGTPNITKSTGDITSFTKSIEVNVKVAGNTFSWKPGGKFYRAYVIGQRPKGNNFYTEGPQVPEIILRDPPGSGSSAYIEKGSKYSLSSKFTTELNNGSGFGLEILLGCEAAAGGGLAGPVIKTDTKNSAKGSVNFSTTVNSSGEYVQAYEFSERVETSSDPGMVGSMADIYIGKSYNYFYGETDHLKIVPYNLATTNGIIALGKSELIDTLYTLGIVEGYVMNPDNSDTYFKYTQSHVLNKLLPELESRRNNLFLTSIRSDGDLKYTSEIENPNDIRYGIAHSYEVKTENGDTIVHAYYKMTDTDSIETYSFRPERVTIEDLNNIQNDTIFEIDSIRYYNSQIGIWLDAIRLNETEKATAIEENVLEQNISFDGGVGSISRKEVQTISYNKEEGHTKNFSFSGQGSLGFLFNETGVIATGEIKVEHKLGVSIAENMDQTMEFGYTLADGNVGDYYSVNIYRRPNNGIYNAKNLEETKKEMPAGFDFSIAGIGGTVIGAGTGALVGFLTSFFTAVSTYGATGGGAVIANASVMAVGGALSYIPYVSFMNEVKDAGDIFSPGDISVSSFDISSPIFSTLGGATMCPYQGMEYTFFYRKANGDSVILNKATMQREKPEITAEPAELYNVPSTDPAIFYVRIANNSETGDGQWYALDVDDASNQSGAMVLIDGELSQKLIHVPANTTVTKMITLQPNNLAVLDYDSIGFILHSTCQFDPTDYMPEIADTVYLSAHFQPACTSVEILEPLDNWVINVRDNDTMTVRIGNYNLAYDSFQSFRFEYKSTSGNIWIPVKYFVNDPELANKDDIPDTTLISNDPFVVFDWSMVNMNDRAYDIRVVSSCTDMSVNESEILTGILDGQRPQVFGTPQPADGILNLDENISIQFNEPIECGLLDQFNFNVEGTLNYYKLDHETYLAFNGAGDYASITEGLSFNEKSFTIEFWIRPESYGNSVILAQGNNPATNLEIGLMSGEKTFFKIGNMRYETSLQFSDGVPPEAWQHMAYVFDNENKDVFIYQNDKQILTVNDPAITFNNSGKIYLGKSSVTGDGYFAGNIHELRIWTKYLSFDDVNANQSIALSGNEVGLYGYWPMDDAFGVLAVDKAANRHMDIFATWQTYPGGYSWNFSDHNFIEFYTGYFAVIPEMDYTVEFWFRSSNPSDTVCLFSCKKGDGNDSISLLNKALSIYATPDGKVWVASRGYIFEAVTTNYFDNSWHHFALVVRRRGNVTSYVDGELQNEKENSIMGGIAGGKMYLGVRKWNNTDLDEDRYYSGKMDEFRLWNLAKTRTQIKMDMNSKLADDETGLLVYFPFEAYYKDKMGVVLQEESLQNFIDGDSAIYAVSANGEAYSMDAANMKDVRPVQEIPYDFVCSDDRIIINPKTYLFPQIEKNIIEMTVQNVEDRYGNRLASPVYWTAYVHRNQVRWEDERRIFKKEVYQPLDFIASIKNTGGEQVGFNILNLPVWMTAYPSSGVINPESTLEINFVVNPALNIGEYNVDIVLRTENGFDEKLPVTIIVHKNSPTWKVDPSKFENTMTIVGKIKIDGVFSTDIFDMLAAFKHGTDSIRGVTNVRYLKDFDSYLVFLTVYGNTPADTKTADSLDFLIWDASAGQILDNVTPFKVVLVDNTVLGTTLNPEIFESTGSTRQHIILKNGWNWVSFNKLSPNMNSLDKFFWALEPLNKDLIKTQNAYAIYYGASGKWSTGITSLDFKRMYQMKTSKIDTIVFSGTDLVPEENSIPLVTGWNHIGYIPDLTMDVSNALQNFVPSASDIIKSQTAFSMYDSRTGWIGTLDVMRPGEGYKFKINGGSAQLKYPNNTILKNGWIVEFLTAPSGWMNDLLQYEGNLSVVAKLDVGKLPNININNQMVLGAFIQNECHGYISPLNQNGLDYNPFFLNVSNNESGQQIEFRLFDGLTGNYYAINEVKPFIQDAVYGTIQAPLVLTLKGLLSGVGGYKSDTYLRCYPNPFNTEVNVEFSGNLNVKSIDISTTSGSLVKRIFNGNDVDGINLVKWDGTNGYGAEVTTGVYFIRVVTDNKVETMKISKTE
jgi:hypothetical protein